MARKGNQEQWIRRKHNEEDEAEGMLKKSRSRSPKEKKRKRRRNHVVQKMNSASAGCRVFKI